MTMAGNCFLRVSTWLKQIYLPWLILLYNREVHAQLNDVSCIVHNEEFMECRWNHTDGEANYTLFYWYTSTSPEECRNYIQENGYNVGCYFSKDKIIEFENFYLYRNGSSDSGSLTKTFQLQNQVKLYPPTNVTLNMTENNELLLSWETPAKLLECRMYEIRHRSNKDKVWQVQVITAQTKYVLSSVDPTKFYTFQVRSKINQYCASTELWSEWSSAVHWGKDPIQSGKIHENYYLFAFLLALGLLIIVLSLLKFKRIYHSSHNQWKFLKVSNEKQ
ncbi:cytokine receptor common subunit gamma-like isoform X2 [Hemiscyllium ocellatum]|uniref:cytokine receptor common subunit gamma-like isoform X2 n=1 Tax=Hemiscyllium ocellatum TaxID=170820 RepID=UPI002965D6D2|nr:cytokine receptor common subunit gamma-like isoform X2 [Hemiscyllium ocellatum]